MWNDSETRGGLGFRVSGLWGLSFRVWGFSVEVLGFRALGFRR